MPLRVELVAPESVLYEGEADMVVCRTTDGDIAFMANHAPFIGALDIHPVVIQPTEGAAVVVAVHGGFVEVSENRVTILSDVAELPDQIDQARAQQAKTTAEEALRTDPEDEAAKQALARAETRLAVKSGTTTTSAGVAH